MTKQELLQKVESRPKKAQAIIRWHHNGDPNNPQIMIYTGHDENYFYGVRTGAGGVIQAAWNQTTNITKIDFFKPDVMTKSSLVAAQKFPINEDRYVGIEMEVISKLDVATLSAEFGIAGLENYVNVVGDGSIRPSTAYPHPHELRILAKEKEFVRVIKQVCKILHGHTSVNKSCGLHVHLDMRKRNPDVAYANLFSSQALLYAMCPKTRLQNNYCKPSNTYSKMVNAAQTADRYHGINASAFNRHKTIEIRIHSGTVNAFKIINWVKLLIQIADKPLDNVDRVSVWRNYKDAKRMVGLRGMLEKYVSSRIEEFAEDHEDSSIRLTA
jgi:hypothetical protein